MSWWLVCMVNFDILCSYLKKPKKKNKTGKLHLTAILLTFCHVHVHVYASKLKVDFKITAWYCEGSRFPFPWIAHQTSRYWNQNLPGNLKITYNVPYHRLRFLSVGNLHLFEYIWRTTMVLWELDGRLSTLHSLLLSDQGCMPAHSVAIQSIYRYIHVHVNGREKFQTAIEWTVW